MPSNLESDSDTSLFQSAFEYAAIGMALVATNGKWLKVNRAVSEITGYDEAELLAHKFQEITHPDDLEEDLVNARRLLAGDIETYRMEKRYFRKDGSTVWVLLSVSLVRDEEGAPRFFISQIQDISAAKESERRLGEAAAEIKKLQRGLLKICSWTQRIHVDGQWITVDEFLRDRLSIKLTHGVSFEGGKLFKDS